MAGTIVESPQENQGATLSDLQNTADAIKAAFYEVAHQLGGKRLAKAIYANQNPFHKLTPLNQQGVSHEKQNTTRVASTAYTTS